MRSDIKKIRNRIEWVDICKFLGILAIYIGHFGTDAGDAYVFVFKYHVPLFFFYQDVWIILINMTIILNI